MKKAGVWTVAIIAVLLVFSTLAYLLRGVTDYIVKQYETEYITPSHKDSLYMGLLQLEQKRPLAMQVSQTVQPFYFIADSTLTILEAQISPEYISDIIINKGLASDIRVQLSQLDTSSLVPCHSCMDSLTENKNAWMDFFKTEKPTALQHYLKQKIHCVDAVEQQVLEQL